LKPAVFAAGVDMNTMPIVAGRLGERPQSEDHSAIERARRHNRSRHRDSVNGGGGGSGTDLTLPAAPPSFHALPAPPVALPAAPSAHPARPSHLDDDPDGLLPPMDDGSDEEAAVADIPPAAKVLHAACPFCSEEGEVDANPDQRINVIRCSSCTKVYGVPTPEELLSDSARPFSARFRPGSARPGSARPSSARSRPASARKPHDDVADDSPSGAGSKKTVDVPLPSKGDGSAAPLWADCPFCPAKVEVVVNPYQSTNLVHCHGCAKMFGVPTPEELLDASAKQFQILSLLPSRPGSARTSRPGSARARAT